MGKNIGASDAGDFASAFSCLKSQQRAGEIPAEIETTDTKKHSPNNIINEQTTVPSTPRDQDNKTEQRHFRSINFFGFGASQQFLFQHITKWEKCVPASLINSCVRILCKQKFIYCAWTDLPLRSTVTFAKKLASSTDLTQPFVKGLLLDPLFHLQFWVLRSLTVAEALCVMLFQADCLKMHNIMSTKPERDALAQNMV